MKRINYLLILISMLSFVTACNNIDYKKTKSGLLYKIFPSKGKSQSRKEGEVVKFHYTLKFNDSLMYTSYGKLPAYQRIQTMEKPSYNLLEILPLMKKGDSAVTVQITDTLMKQGVQLPPNAKKGDRIITTVRILDVFASDSTALPDYKAEMKKDEPRHMKEQEEEMAKMQKEQEQQQQKEIGELEKSGEVSKELKEIETYLKQKKINAQKTGTGTYVYIEQQGTGPAVEPGKYLKVKYTGKHLSTDSTFESGVYPFQLGKSPVIRGWVEGLPLFKQGGKGTLYIPGFLAYGKNPEPGSPFKSFEALKFDVEILEVSDKPIPQQPTQ
jgi:FKBP-type peptidyl-prolyl cis-trans isomerase FkpA